jgi:triacylglycerol esterase/lipase EstA (alpha/beta hydrolase family)
MLQTVSTILSHLLVTLPSIVYHGLINEYNRITALPLVNEQTYNNNIVIFVHGRGGHHSNFTPLIENIDLINMDDMDSFLSSKCKFFMRTVDLGDTTDTSIDDDVAKLQECLNIYRECRIILVGLSKGGVVIMRYITTIDDTRIQKIITISSPLHGTYATTLLSDDSITNKELCYKSQITQDIAKSNISIPIFHVAPMWDHLIIPTNSAIYSTTDQNNIYYYSGLYSHTGIIHDMDIAYIILHWIS